MRYQTGAAFRRALEDRLRTQSRVAGESLVRLRKMVAFERLLARMLATQPGAWVLKGGLALQLRLGKRARTTKDMDVLLARPRPDLHALLIEAATQDLGDWFEFQVERPTRRLPPEFGGQRFHAECILDGRRFERFQLDVGVDDRLVEPVEELTMPGLLTFAGLDPTIAPCYPLVQQIAEKLHAYTLPRVSGESSRVKDLVDILLLAEMYEYEGATLRRAIQATFEARGTHPLPAHLPEPPGTWAPPFRKLADEVGLEQRDLTDAGRAAHAFLDGVLGGEAITIWNPSAGQWN
ncbi:MAG: nucleotidyl transferase AbiEii/AbiGii toxin family protein [Anaerolineales bacterium]